MTASKTEEKILQILSKILHGIIIIVPEVGTGSLL